MKRQIVVDAYHILNKLRAENAFCYCAVVKIDAMLSSLNTPQRQVIPLPGDVMHADTLKDVLQLNQANAIAQQYHIVKTQYATANNLQQQQQQLQPYSQSMQQTHSTVNALQIAKPTFAADMDNIIAQHKNNKPVRSQSFNNEVALSRSGRNARVAARTPSSSASSRSRRKQADSPSIVDSMRQLFPTIARAAASDDDDDDDSDDDERVPATPSTSIITTPATPIVTVKQEPTSDHEQENNQSSKQAPPAKQKKQIARSHAVSSINAVVEAFIHGRPLPPSANEMSLVGASRSDSVENSSQEQNKTKRKKKSKEASDDSQPKQKRPRTTSSTSRSKKKNTASCEQVTTEAVSPSKNSEESPSTDVSTAENSSSTKKAKKSTPKNKKQPPASTTAPLRTSTRSRKKKELSDFIMNEEAENEDDEA